jgi:hypothetical protein
MEFAFSEIANSVDHYRPRDVLLLFVVRLYDQRL